MAAMTPLRLIAVLLVAAPLLTGCGGEEEPEPADDTSAPAEQVVEKAKPTATPEPTPEPPGKKKLGEGLSLEVTEAGEGASPKDGDSVRLEGRFIAPTSGTELWSGEWGFRVGSGQGIEGLDRAVREMSVGDTARIEIPQEMALLPVGVPMPGSESEETVMIEATLLEITPADE